MFHVVWTDNNGKKRKITVQLHSTAVAILNAMILNCQQYDAKITGKSLKELVNANS